MSKRRSRQRDLHGLVYHRAAWQCQMPECLCPDGHKIDRALRGTDSPWAPSVDHIKPLSAGGRDQLVNMRAAHQRCNQAAVPQQEAAAAGKPPPPPLSVTIGDMFPDLACLGRRDPELFSGDQGSAWS